MPDFRYTLMVTDLDATFFSHPSRLSPRNREAVAYFTAHGGYFTAATSRIPPNIRHAIPDCATLFNAPAIAANGAYIYDLAADRLIHGVPLDGALAKEVALFVQKLTPEVGVRVSTRSGNLINANRLVPALLRDMGLIPDSTGTPGSDTYKTADGQPVPALTDPATVKLPADSHSILRAVEDWDPAAEPWYKMVFRGEPDAIRTVRPVVEATFGDAFEYNTSSPRLYELQVKGCTKASGLAFLRDYLSDKEHGHAIRTVAVGDQENDLPMLRAADVAACPANAIPEVQAVADHRLCHCDEGCIADLVERLG